MPKPRPLRSTFPLFLVPTLVLILLGALCPPTAQGVSTEVLFSCDGEANYDLFGNQVANAGDVNGDGYDDVIVGAANNDAAGSNAGRAYVFFGGPLADDDPDLILTGEATEDYFGDAVAGPGDLNGDGYADVVVGARGNDAGGAGAGRVYVYYGGAHPDTVADLVITGAVGEALGRSIAAAGDVNGDGAGDFIVGATGYNSRTGRAYVYYGGYYLTDTPYLTFTGEAANDELGQAVAGPGDVNGDGYADLLVSAYYNDAAGTDAGRAYLYYGGPGADGTADRVLTGEAAGDQFGQSLGGGDVDGDGYGDLLISAPFEDSSGTSAGKVYLYLGGPNIDNAPDLILTGVVANDLLGYDVTVMGDVNGDAYADFAVSSECEECPGGSTGRVYVHFGSAEPDTVPDAILLGAEASDSYGRGLGGGGDVDGDGRAELIVGAPLAKDPSRGAAYVYAFYPYRILCPRDRQDWVKGESSAVRWQGHDPADLHLSVDGGLSWALLATGAGGSAINQLSVVAPAAADQALIRLTYRGQASGPSTSTASGVPFRIVPPSSPAAQQLRLELGAEAAGDNFGDAVAPAGDFNGDGHPDLLVGAYFNDVAGSNAGRAYVFFGGPEADDVPDVVFNGEAAGDHFGDVLDGIGDINGDGCDDVIVGAYQNTAGGSWAGRAYVYLGGASPDSLVDLVITGLAGDYLGAAVAGAGDVDGDGFDDFLVGAYSNDDGGQSAGLAHLFLGNRTPDNVADYTFTGWEAGLQLGKSVAGVGDFNGDGHDDMIVGADDRRAFLYLGGAYLDEEPDLEFVERAPLQGFARVVAGPGDVNGDGYADVLIGAPYDDASGHGVGRAYLYFGGPAADAIPDRVFVGESENSYFGGSVAGAGDVNDDGCADLIVGAYYYDLETHRGRAYVFLGGADADASPDLVITGKFPGDRMGSAVAGVGDVDGDGLDDVLVGASFAEKFGSAAGAAYLFSMEPFRVLSPNGGEKWQAGGPAEVRWQGRAMADVSLSRDGGFSWTTLAAEVGGASENALEVIAPESSDQALIRITHHGEASVPANSDLSDAPFRILPPANPVAWGVDLAPVGEVSNDEFGNQVARAGDVNGDGFDDLLVGAPFSLSGTGRAYVLFGGPGADEVPDLVMTGEAAGDRFGLGISGAGDVNGDGFDDVIVGAYSNDALGSNTGRAYLFHGGVSPDATPDLIMTGLDAGDYFGYSVSGAGDVNGDGFADVAVGAIYAEDVTVSVGAVYVFFGGPAADAVADWTLYGEAADDLFGSSIAGPGDVDADGYDDLLVGAYRSDPYGVSNAGRAYLFRGGQTPDDLADFRLDGEAANDWFGIRVAGAGDVDGDGHPDFLVGASEHDTGGNGAGRAYIYHGGPGMDAAPDLVMDGETGGDKLGYSLSGAGDVNGDGFDDVVIGAYYCDIDLSRAGRVYVFHGGPGMDAVPEVTIPGETEVGYLGKSVAGVGDVNGDGFDDVLAGSLGDDTGGTNAGRAFLYDFNRYRVVSPAGGDTWNVGAKQEIRWRGAEPADLWLSVDGGNSYALLESDAGGKTLNGITLTVPHQPTRFAKVKITPSDASVLGSAKSDSLFTIEASIALLNLKAAPIDAGGVLLSWQTDPGPEDLAGYRIERADPGEDWRTLVALTRETEYHDAGGAAGMSYRLFGINGLGEELLLGETALTPRAALAAWPQPYRGGDLTVSFLTASGRGGGPAPADVALFDLQGRRVRTLDRGEYTAGYRTVVWDGRDDAGRPVASGIYFLHAVTGGESARIKLVVVR